MRGPIIHISDAGPARYVVIIVTADVKSVTGWKGELTSVSREQETYPRYCLVAASRSRSPGLHH